MKLPFFRQTPFLDNHASLRRADTRWGHPRGGAAIEYIIVSTFAMLMAIGAIVFVSKAVKTRIAKLEEKLGVTFDSDSLDIFK